MFLLYFPEWRSYCEKIQKEYSEMIDGIQETYRSLKHTADPKEFAFKARQHWFFFLLFFMKKGTSKSAAEYYALAEPKDLIHSWQNPKRKPNQAQHE